uniref:Uncharacterized protein n=1 Tax=Octopus bimaculoides TaxID=37653 RepID=A0A0L8FPS3_OCTBM
MEFLSTPFLQIEQGHLPEGICDLSAFLLTNTLVFARLTLRPFDLRLCSILNSSDNLEYYDEQGVGMRTDPW